MARTALGVTGSSKTGELMLPAVNADPIDYNSVNNNGETIITVVNTGATTHTLTVLVEATVDGLPVAGRPYTLTAGQTIIAGPYPTWWYGTTLLLNADSSELTLAAFRPGTGLPAPGAPPGAAFTFSAPAVVADTSFAGLTQSGDVLTVDTVLTSSTVDGDVLVVTV